METKAPTNLLEKQWGPAFAGKPYPWVAISPEVLGKLDRLGIKTMNELKVLVGLLSYEFNKELHPGTRLLGERCNLDHTTVARIVRKFKRLGLLDYEEGHLGVSNYYDLRPLLRKLHELPEAGSTQGTPSPTEANPSDDIGIAPSFAAKPLVLELARPPAGSSVPQVPVAPSARDSAPVTMSTEEFIAKIMARSEASPQAPKGLTRQTIALDTPEKREEALRRLLGEEGPAAFANAFYEMYRQDFPYKYEQTVLLASREFGPVTSDQIRAALESDAKPEDNCRDEASALARKVARRLGKEFRAFAGAAVQARYEEDFPRRTA